ncbi:rCG36724 [Rattus norvegicus]|uniref:RCG36724 n=1 Tax=Rattus norvegicus TaxID=10116 RepID=A6JSI4_RAT|nr:rCG36724 [Rattus norvegicus]
MCLGFCRHSWSSLGLLCHMGLCQSFHLLPQTLDSSICVPYDVVLSWLLIPTWCQ